MDSLLQKIKTLSEAEFSNTLRYRHHIHKNPELSFEEFKTAEFVENTLKQLGLKDVKRTGKTGVTALLKENNGGPLAALRADLDALPIQEENNQNYASVNPGIMHACGHDVHTALLLTCAAVLKSIENEIPGNIRFIFQPGEEKLPGGAALLIDEGILSNPAVDFIIGQHVSPEIPCGKAGFKAGLFMASTDEIYVRFTGKGGHAAQPENYLNPITAAAAFLLKCEQLFKQKKPDFNPNEIPLVQAFGKITAAGATNVIPQSCFIEGTLRTLDEKVRLACHAELVKLAELVQKETGVRIDLDIRKGYPCLINDETLTQSSVSYASAYLNTENILSIPYRMTAEDFAFYSHKVPALFYRIGTGNIEKGITAGVHTPRFDIDEEVLKFAPGLMAWICICQLKSRICY